MIAHESRDFQGRLFDERLLGDMDLLNHHIGVAFRWPKTKKVQGDVFRQYWQT